MSQNSQEPTDLNFLSHDIKRKPAVCFDLKNFLNKNFLKKHHLISPYIKPVVLGWAKVRVKCRDAVVALAEKYFFVILINIKLLNLIWNPSLDSLMISLLLHITGDKVRSLVSNPF